VSKFRPLEVELQLVKAITANAIKLGRLSLLRRTKLQENLLFFIKRLGLFKEKVHQDVALKTN
jgi:hypothetical protein